MEIPATLFAALDLVVFRRRPDGTFVGEGQVPAWFTSLTGDQTFPFLGTFLETANEFWARSAPGTVRSGLCEQADAAGRPFHFEVVAITMDGQQYLVFERRLDAEASREILQKARDLALEHERVTRQLERHRADLSAALNQVDASACTLSDLAAELISTPLSPDQRALADRLRQSGTMLTGEIDTIRRTLVPKGQAG
jgi:hypothetical protein